MNELVIGRGLEGGGQPDALEVKVPVRKEARARAAQKRPDSPVLVRIHGDRTARPGFFIWPQHSKGKRFDQLIVEAGGEPVRWRNVETRLARQVEFTPHDLARYIDGGEFHKAARPQHAQHRRGAEVGNAWS